MQHSFSDRRNISKIIKAHNELYPEQKISFEPTIRPYFKNVDYVAFISLKIDLERKEVNFFYLILLQGKVQEDGGKRGLEILQVIDVNQVMNTE